MMIYIKDLGFVDTTNLWYYFKSKDNNNFDTGLMKLANDSDARLLTKFNSENDDKSIRVYVLQAELDNYDGKMFFREPTMKEIMERLEGPPKKRF